MLYAMHFAGGKDLHPEPFPQIILEMLGGCQRDGTLAGYNMGISVLSLFHCD